MEHCLAPRHAGAAREVIREVRLRVPAVLEQAFLFGSRARGTERPDSDVDLLLVFRHLPPDREPQAGHAEAIAEEVAERTGVPVQVWCVSLEDLEEGRRTPMLVDALEDGVPLWPEGAPPAVLPFTPADALFCARALLDRVEEGSSEVTELRQAGDPAWARRTRDDLVRLCTAALLIAGETRPRRAEAVRCFLSRNQHLVPLSRSHLGVLAWAARSYGPGSGDEEARVAPPPVPFRVVADLMERLRAVVIRRGRRARRAGVGGAFVRR